MAPPIWIWFAVMGLGGVGAGLFGWTLWLLFDFGLGFFRFLWLLAFLIPLLLVEIVKDLWKAWPRWKQSFKAGWRRGRGEPPEELDENGIPYL